MSAGLLRCSLCLGLCREQIGLWYIFQSAFAKCVRVVRQGLFVIWTQGQIDLAVLGAAGVTFFRARL
jgi:hypothetical protein